MTGKRMGRPPAIRSRGELTGMGAWRIPHAALVEFGRWFDPLDEEPEGAEIEESEPAPMLAAAWAAYCADVEALDKLPSAADERADLRAIAADARSIAATMAERDALRLWQRLENFPPISRSIIAPDGPGLLAFEGLLAMLRQVLPRPALWPQFFLADALLALARACEECPSPPSFTKRPLTARARLIKALQGLWDAHAEPDPASRDEFTRRMLEALGVPVPDRF